MEWTLADFLAMSPVLALLLGGLLVLAADMIFPRDRSGLWTEGAAYAGFLGSLVLLVMLRFPCEPQSCFGGLFREDMLSRMIMAAVVVSGVFFVLLSSRTIERTRARRAEFLSLALFSAAGMGLLSMSGDLIGIFLSVELMSLAVYAMAGMSRTDLRAGEAALKYFVNGSFASAFLLFGMAMIYGATGEVQLAAMQQVKYPLIGQIGILLMMAGFGFKVGAVPFHFWVADVYEGAPVSVTAFMAVAVKAAGFAALIRFLMVGFSGSPEIWQGPVILLSVVTMIVGNLMALAQRSVKRMLAYSSVAHTGYVLLGVAAGAVGPAVFYLFTYVFMTVGAFAFIGFVTREGRDAERLEDHAGLARKHPLPAAVMALFLVSLAGFPPTAGFFAKFGVFQAALGEGSSFYLPVVIGLLTSAISVYYYLRVGVQLYMKPVEGPEAEISDDSGTRMVIGVAAVAVLLLGLLPGRYYSYAELAERALQSVTGW